MSFRGTRNLIKHEIMKTFEAEYKNFFQRFFNIKNAIYIEFFIIISSLLFILDLEKSHILIIIIYFFIITISLIIFRCKSDIQIITFEEKNIILQGETFNTKWKKSMKINETKIYLKSFGSKSGICGATFQIQLKNSNEFFNINMYQTISENKLIDIFNQFKEFKSEKIIIDEKLIIISIKEKIEKCQ